MPDLDLEPHEYRDRKPKGWRWRLPLGNPEDNRLPLIMFGIELVVLWLIFDNRNALTPEILFGVTAVFSASAAIMFTLFMRD